MKFIPSDDPAFIFVQKEDGNAVEGGRITAKTPIELATASYLLQVTREEAEEEEEGQYVMFSLCVPEDNARSMIACVRKHPKRKSHRRSAAAARVTKWPEWNSNPPSTFTSAPMNKWVSLPVIGVDCQSVLKTYSDQRLRRDVKLNQQINKRCEEIKEQGMDEAYTESLGYYITLRVKLAYLLLNQDGIEKRLQQVRNSQAVTRRALEQALPELERQWEPPTAIVTPEDNDDPNAVACPQVEDYAIFHD